jgi:hypothetical protein
MLINIFKIVIKNALLFQARFEKKLKGRLGTHGSKK